jgi:hypothetical protein
MDAIHLNDSGTHALIENNILHRFDFGVNAKAGATAFVDYNQFATTYMYDTDYYHYILSGPHNFQSANTGFVNEGEDNPDLRLTESSDAIDKASPDEPVPPGGGARADLGYKELVALPVTVFLGKEGPSSAVGNSGVKRVEVAVVPVADPRRPPQDTLPTTWTSVYDDPTTSEQKVTWQMDATPGASGLYRVYGKAEDRVGNASTDEREWYLGAFIADDTPPVVALVDPTPGANVTSPLDLRATVTDTVMGEFSVESVLFEVDGQPYTASWTGEAWDVRSSAPRPFHRWLDLPVGQHTVVAVAYDRAGNRGTSAPVVINVTAQTAADTTPPTLTVTSPVTGTVYRDSVVFEGTAADGESGLLAVQVSVDSGVTWIPATVTGNSWRLDWKPPWHQDYVSFSGKVRALDKAGNATEQAITFIVDNQAPTIRTRAPRFFHNFQEAPPGTHFDDPATAYIEPSIYPPYDGSDPSGEQSTEVQVFADQSPTAEPSPLYPWKSSYDVFYTDRPTFYFYLPGEWYIHIFRRDAKHNMRADHYGPWYVGSFLDQTTDCTQRRQTIVVDGFLDLDRQEWTENEFMDDDVRGMDSGHPRQSLYITWAGDAVYVGWRGAWWGADGTMWIYLGIQTTTDVLDDGTTTSVDGQYTLPFRADIAVRILDPDHGELYHWDQNAGVWTGPDPVEFANGLNGDTEVRIPWDIPTDLHDKAYLLAFAENPWGGVWSAFPTTNDLDGQFHYYYTYRTLCDPLLALADVQPVRTWIDIAASQDPPALRPVGPGTPVTYTLRLINLEAVTVPVTSLVLTPTQGLSLTQVSGVTCAQCGALDPAWTLDVPLLAPSATLPITITGVITGNLANITQTLLSVTQFISTTVVNDLSLSYYVDPDAPEVQITSPPGDYIGTGFRYLTGVTRDWTAVALVAYSTDGGATWQPAIGTQNWIAPVNVPESASTFEVRIRAVDVYGQSTEISKTFLVDTTEPQIDVNIPPYLTGPYGTITGQTIDLGPLSQHTGLPIDVAFQFAQDPTTWQNAMAFEPDANGVVNWVATWPLPLADGITQTLRFQVIDAVGNITTTDWFTVTVDNVAPSVIVTQTLGQVSLNDPGQPVVLQGLATDGTGIQDITLFLYAPDGSVQQVPLAWTPTRSTYASEGLMQQVPLAGTSSGNNAVTWAYVPDLNILAQGDYTLRVQITDLAGNVRNLGPYSMSVVSCLTPDLAATFVTAEPLTDTIRIDVRVDNAGGGLPAGLPVAFYMDGALLDTAATTQVLNAGQSEIISILWNGAQAGDHQLRVALNDDGTGGAPLNLCAAPPEIQQTVSILDVPLAEGWNLISSYVNPFTSDVNVVQRPISGTYVVIQGFDQGAQSYYPDLPSQVNSLREIDAEHGYWVKVSSQLSVNSDQLSVNSEGRSLNTDHWLLNTERAAQAVATWRFVGSKFAEDRPIPLDVGWNLVSYLPRASMPITQALQSIEGQYFAVLGFDLAQGGALSYYPDLDPSFNTLHALEPLHGYWIRMVTTGTLRYPVSSNQLSVNSDQLTVNSEGRSLSTDHWSLNTDHWLLNTDHWNVRPTHIWVNFYGSTSLSSGTVIQAVDPDGVVCGVAVVRTPGKYGLLACYGDDPTTAEDEGAQPGDRVRLVVEGETLATGVWTAHGERQWVPLGAVELQKVWLPLVVRD